VLNAHFFFNFFFVIKKFFLRPRWRKRRWTRVHFDRKW